MTGAPARPDATAPPVLVTGASGFIGARLVTALIRAGVPVRRSLSPRRAAGRAPDADEVAYDLTADEQALAPLVAGCGAVVHLAGLAHEAGRGRGDEDFHAANVAATERLARAAVHGGARRFVFMSTAKVFGERSPRDHSLDEHDPPRPHGPYARSKWAAEQAIARVAAQAGLEPVILRPPLVVGPGVKANFLQLVDAVARGVPLPLARVRNARSLVGVDNLVAAIERCLFDVRAPGETFVVADPAPLATPELVRAIAAALGVRARLWPVPVSLLEAAARLAGRGAALEKITGDFVVAAHRLETTLDWRAAVPLSVTLAETAAWYRSVAAAGARRPGE